MILGKQFLYVFIDNIATNYCSESCFVVVNKTKDSWSFEARSESLTPLSKKVFLLRIKDDSYFRKGFVHALKSVTFRDFTFTIGRIDKNSWASTNSDYTFKVERLKVLYPSCTKGEFFKIARNGHVWIGPCLNDKLDQWKKKFSLASFIRNGDENQVR